MGKEMWPKRNCTFDFNTFIGLKVELPCQKTKSFWTKSLHVLSLQKSSNFYSSRFKKTQRSPSCWSMENWSSIPNDHFSLRMSSHVGSNFCPNMSMPKKTPKINKNVCPKLIPTKNQRRWHAPAKSMALPRTSASAKPPRERCRMDINSRSNLRGWNKPRAPWKSWLVNDWGTHHGLHVSIILCALWIESKISLCGSSVSFPKRLRIY